LKLQIEFGKLATIRAYRAMPPDFIKWDMPWERKLLDSAETSVIKVRVKLYGVFRISRFKEEMRSYPAGVTVREVVADLRLPGHLLGIVVINDLHAGTEAILHDGDTLALFPLLDGG
jgi:molybdopterin converting factor small subunit